MSRVEMIRTQIEYNYALFDQLWDSIMTLSEDQFNQHVDYSHGSIRAQMFHIALTEVRWEKGLKGEADPRQFSLDPKDYPTRESIHTLWDETVQRMKDYARAVNEDKLNRVPRGMPGPVWHVLTHLVNHGTDHRAQVLRLLHDFGAPTFDQDLIIHLWVR